MSEAVIKLILAYLLGSVSGSLLLGKLKGVDIRKSGSGNAGGTNALRTQGFLFALGVVVIDVGKGIVAAGWLPSLQIMGEPLPVGSLELALACGGLAVVGHCFPVFHGFRGGKGVATLLGVLLVLMPWALPLFFGSFFIVLVLSGWVGLGSIIAGLSLIPATLWLSPQNTDTSVLLFSIVMGVYVLAMHQSNIRNMWNGTEHHFRRVMLSHYLFKD